MMIYKIQNYLLRRCFYIKQFNIDVKKVIWLTFDDGPEDGITEFVLNELEKYNYRATFFCRGDNAEKHPELMGMLKEKGHSIGNHTYSHLHAYKTKSKEYVADVEKAGKVLGSLILFRPPHGSLTFCSWWKLRHKKILYWALNSEDSSMEKFNFQHVIDKLKEKTHNGDVVLFHFCHRHEKETRTLLPAYLAWLHEQGYQSKAIPE